MPDMMRGEIVRERGALLAMTYAMRSLALLASAAVASAAYAGPSDSIGSAISVVNTVNAKYEAEARKLVIDDSVRQNELIEVAKDSRGEFQFEDNTKLALGPGAKLTLDKFVYDPNRGTGTIIVDLAKGALRFVTGVAEKRAYKIKTPVASISVRGTIFDLFVFSDNTTWLLLHEGAVVIETSPGNCRVVTEVGKFISISPQRQLGTPAKWTALNGRQAPDFDSVFPFVGRSPSFESDTTLSREAIVTGNIPNIATPDQGVCAASQGIEPQDTPNDPPPTKPKQRETYKKPQKKQYAEPRQPRQVYVKPKKQRYAKRRERDDDSGISGADVVRGAAIIGLGIALGSRRRHHGGGGY